MPYWASMGANKDRKMKEKKWSIMLLIYVVGALVAFSSCSKDDDEVSGGGGTTQTGNSYGTLGENDIAATGDAKDIAYLSATMLGSINNNILLGKDFKVYFLISENYKTESDLIFENTHAGDSTRLEVKNLVNNKIEHRCSCLDANTEYFYRTCVKVGNQYFYGGVKKFTTNDLSKAVNISITSIDEVTAYSAKIRYEDKSDPIAIKELGRYTDEAIYFNISKNPEFIWDLSFLFPENANFVEISNLEPNTKYYCKITYYNKGRHIVSERVFTTADGKREVGKTVDLGLSVKWADRNIGAFSEECKGWLFSFGEVGEKEEYTEDNYKWKEWRFTQDFFKKKNIVDDNGILTQEYDAAAVNWGNGWRMPTMEQVRELIGKCEIEKCIIKNVKGLKIIGPNGNSIFIPYHVYWSANSEIFENSTSFGCNAIYGWYSDPASYLYEGLPIRPVHN